MTTRRAVPLVPASFFGLVLGLAGLGTAWRVAHRIWHLPAVVGEALMLLAALVWVVLIVLYGLKWLLARPAAEAEVAHPVQCCFISLIGVSTMLMAFAALPYAVRLAAALYAVGGVFSVGFAVWRTGALWRGDRDATATTPVLYLPTGATCFVGAAVGAALGYADWGQLAFGAGLLSSLAIESVLLHRLYTAAPMAPALRPTLGIQLAPSTVGLVAYLAVTDGPPGLLGHALLGYGILQALVLARMMPWIAVQPFAVSYWGFTFGLSALATGALRLVERGDAGAPAVLAPLLFVIANGVIGVIALATLRLAVQGRLLPTEAPASR